GGTGKTVVAAGGAMYIYALTHIADGRVIDNSQVTTDWQSGTISSTAGHSFKNLGLLTISGNNSNTYLDSGTFDNAGTVLRTGTGDWYFQNGAVFNNLPGSLFDIQNNGRIFYNVGAAVLFNNQGTLRRSAGTGTLGVENGLPVTNSGTVQ